MSDRTDHKAEARLWIENAISAQATPAHEHMAGAYSGLAQAHATLALVEATEAQTRMMRTVQMALAAGLPHANRVALLAALEAMGFES